METTTPKAFTFGEFELDVVRRSLYRDGEQVALNSRAFDLLLELVMRRGEILSKDALLEKVWDGQFVEEGNLTVHISALRKIFGEKKDENRFITTVPGRGYSFVAELTDANTIIESHSLTRIIVEEEFSDSDSTSVQRRERPALVAKPKLIDWLKQNVIDRKSVV